MTLVALHTFAPEGSPEGNVALGSVANVSGHPPIRCRALAFKTRICSSELGEKGRKTHRDVAVGLDLVDPEGFLHEGACPAQQLLQLPESEGSHLRKRTPPGC